MGKPLTVTDPRTDGLPALNTSSTKRDGQHFFLCLGIEALTHDLRQGRAISADAIRAAELIVQRAEALNAALISRYSQQVTIIDDEDEK